METDMSILKIFLKFHGKSRSENNPYRKIIMHVLVIFLLASILFTVLASIFIKDIGPFPFSGDNKDFRIHRRQRARVDDKCSRATNQPEKFLQMTRQCRMSQKGYAAFYVYL